MSVVALARLLSCCALVVSTAVTNPAVAQPVPDSKVQAAPQGGKLCIDEMVTDPDRDDPDPIPVALVVDGGCLIAVEPIST